MTDPALIEAGAGHTLKQPTVAQRARHEFIELLGISAYFFVWFGTLLFYKSSILGVEGIHSAPIAFALGKALILGKFVLMGHMGRLGDRGMRARPLLQVIKKSMLFTLLLIALSVVEEVVTDLVDRRTLSRLFAGIAGGTLREALAASLLMLLILLPYFAFREVAQHLGEGKLIHLLTAPRSGNADG